MSVYAPERGQSMLLHALIKQKLGGAPPAEVRVITRDRARRWGLHLDELEWQLAVEDAITELSAGRIRGGVHDPGWLVYEGAEGPLLRRRATLAIYPGTWGGDADAHGSWEGQGVAAADERVNARLRQLVHPFAEGPRLAAELALECPRERVLAPFALKLTYYVRGAVVMGADGEMERRIAEDEIERGFRAECRRLAGMAPVPRLGRSTDYANVFTATAPAGEG